MFQVKQFAYFAEIQTTWETLASQSFHYPFQSFWYNKLFAETFIKQENLLLLGIYENETLLALGAFEKDKQTVRFVGMKPVLGKEEVTDFGNLLFSEKGKQKAQDIWQTLLEFFKQQSLQNIQLDYVRQDSPTYVYFKEREQTTIQQQETSPFLVLPASWDAYLASLEKKQRHELKRKINRLEKQTAFHLCQDQTVEEDFKQFVRLHKLSDEQKDKFMSLDMQQFFWKMVTCEKKDWEIHFCSLFIDNQQVASVMAFMNKDQTLLYNSGFDPQYGYFSVGLLVKAFLIKKSIEQGKKVYDFLRGNERYKYDLGAKDLLLYKITLTV